MVEGPHRLQLKTPPLYNWKNGLLAWFATDTGPSATASARALVSAVTSLSPVTAEPAAQLCKNQSGKCQPFLVAVRFYDASSFGCIMYREVIQQAILLCIRNLRQRCHSQQIAALRIAVNCQQRWQHGPPKNQLWRRPSIFRMSHDF